MADEKLVGFVKVILQYLPRYECCDFHHSRDDRHGSDRECPVLTRFNSAVEDARDSLEEQDRRYKNEPR